MGKIYIYDHASKVPVSSYLGRFVQDGWVDVKYFNHDPTNPDEYEIGKPYEDDFQGIRVQFHVYTECFKTHGHRHKFMGVFDVDEFLELVDWPEGSTEPLADFMEEFSEHGGLKISCECAWGCREA